MTAPMDEARAELTLTHGQGPCGAAGATATPIAADMRGEPCLESGDQWDQWLRLLSPGLPGATELREGGEGQDETEGRDEQVCGTQWIRHWALFLSPPKHHRSLHDKLSS